MKKELTPTHTVPESHASTFTIINHSLREVIKKHIGADASDVGRLEGLGALNFLAIDDLLGVHEGAHIDPDSMIILEFQNIMGVVNLSRFN